jgi:hypothetical protein
VIAGGSRPRRPLRLVVGVLMVLLSSLLGVAVISRVDRRVPVLVVVRTVRPGQAITADDLGTVKVAGRGLATLPPSAMGKVVGRAAASLLAAGTPVAMAELATTGSQDPNLVELPMLLKAGQFPPDLARGDRVYLIGMPGSGASTAGQPGALPPLVTGRVVAIEPQKSFGSAGSTTLTVSVQKTAAAALAVASSTGAVVAAKAAGS